MELCSHQITHPPSDSRPVTGTTLLNLQSLTLMNLISFTTQNQSSSKKETNESGIINFSSGNGMEIISWDLPLVFNRHKFSKETSPPVTRCESWSNIEYIAREYFYSDWACFSDFYVTFPDLSEEGKVVCFIIHRRMEASLWKMQIDVKKFILYDIMRYNVFCLSNFY